MYNARDRSGADMLSHMIKIEKDINEKANFLNMNTRFSSVVADSSSLVKMKWGLFFTS